MQEAFVNIANVPTHIMTWGHWIEESFTKKEVIICFTGNPGLPGFYTKFLATIHENVGTDIPVWIIGMLRECTGRWVLFRFCKIRCRTCGSRRTTKDKFSKNSQTKGERTLIRITRTTTA